MSADPLSPGHDLMPDWPVPYAAELPEFDADDAPAGYDNEQAHAWACGAEHARDLALRLLTTLRAELRADLDQARANLDQVRAERDGLHEEVLLLREAHAEACEQVGSMRDFVSRQQDELHRLLYGSAPQARPDEPSR